MIQSSEAAIARSQWLLQRLDPWRPGAAPALDRILAQAIGVTGAHMGNIQVLHHPTASLRIASSQGFDPEFLTYFASVEDGHSACGVALKRGERIIVEDVPASPIFRGIGSLPVMMKAGCMSVQSTPIMSRRGLVGMLSTHRRVAWSPDRSERQRLDKLAAEAATVLDILGVAAPSRNVIAYKDGVRYPAFGNARAARSDRFVGGRVKPTVLYRRRAEAARDLALNASEPVVRMAWEMVAEQWLTLAETAQQIRQRASSPRGS